MAQDSASPSISQRLRAWGQMAQQVIDVRLALVMGLLAFVLAVSVDSAGNAAEAADLANSTYFPAVAVTVVAPQPSGSAAASPALDEPAVARRLHHGILTSAILTNNRMTEAHFFMDLPAEE